MDKLEEIFEIQKAFSGHWVRFGSLNSAQQSDVAQRYVLDAYSELAELREAINDKAWRNPLKPRDAVLTETADIIAYLVSILHCYEFTADDLHRAYLTKMTENEKQWQEMARRQE